MNKIQVVCYLDVQTYGKLVINAQDNNKGTLSKAVNAILKEYFNEKDAQEAAVGRLNKVIQNIVAEKDKAIQELEHKLKNSKILKEGAPNEDKV